MRAQRKQVHALPDMTGTSAIIGDEQACRHPPAAVSSNWRTMSNQPPVAWPEIRDHLVKRLMLDDRWTLHGEEALIWQPWLLPVHIEVIKHGQYDDGYPWVAVSAWMRILDLPEEPGLAFAEAGNRNCPMATFLHDDGQLIASVGVMLNGDGRSNLVWFHNALLAMATVAHQLATEMLEDLRPPDLDPEEALLGRRDAPDELLSVFAGPGLPLPAMEQVTSAWQLARPLLAQRLASSGFEPGYRDDQVDFYVMAGTPVGAGLHEDTGRYGPGVDVVAMVTGPMDPEPPYPGIVNDANSMLVSRSYCNVGNVHWSDSGQGWGGLQLSSYLPGAFLAEFRQDPGELATVVFNALMQISQSTRALAASGPPA